MNSASRSQRGGRAANKSGHANCAIATRRLHCAQNCNSSTQSFFERSVQPATGGGGNERDARRRPGGLQWPPGLGRSRCLMARHVHQPRIIHNALTRRRRDAQPRVRRIPQLRLPLRHEIRQRVRPRRAVVKEPPAVRFHPRPDRAQPAPPKTSARAGQRWKGGNGERVGWGACVWVAAPSSSDFGRARWPQHGPQHAPQTARQGKRMRVRQQTSRQPQWSFTCTFFQICGRPQQQPGDFVSLLRLCLF